MGGVPHPKNEENVVVREVVEKKEPLTFNRDTPLLETRMKGVQSESTLNSSSEEEFVVSNDNMSNEPSQDVSKERPQRQPKEWLWDWWIVTKKVERCHGPKSLVSPKLGLSPKIQVPTLVQESCFLHIP